MHDAGEFIEEPVRQHDGVLLPDVGEQYAELVCPAAPDDVRSPELRLKKARQPDDHAVARRVSVAQVDAPQAIDVDQEKRGRVVPPAAAAGGTTRPRFS